MVLKYEVNRANQSDTWVYVGGIAKIKSETAFMEIGEYVKYHKIWAPEDNHYDMAMLEKTPKTKVKVALLVGEKNDGSPILLQTSLSAYLLNDTGGTIERLN